MFGKLFRYDFKAIARTQMPALFALLCLTVLGCLNAGVMCVSAEHDSGFMALLSGGGFMLIVTAFAGIVMVMSLLIYVRFYKSTVTDEAYTTFTLPVKPSRILGAKFLSALVWYLIICAACVAAILLLCLTMAASIGSRQEFAAASAQTADIVSGMGLDAGSVILLLVSAFVSSASRILQIFTAILFGASVVRKHKALAAVGMIFVINFAVNIVTSVFGLTSGTMLTANAMTADFGSYMTGMMLPQTAILIVIAVLCWLACTWMMKHKVNLD